MSFTKYIICDICVVLDLQPASWVSQCVTKYNKWWKDVHIPTSPNTTKKAHKLMFLNAENYNKFCHSITSQVLDQRRTPPNYKTMDATIFCLIKAIANIR
jgi:hypothetical protein